ncbi:MAG: GAF domain-containing protein, partial [Salinivirgaceae bacterium]
IIAILLGVTKRILSSIKRLRAFISRLGEGELPENIDIKKNDEIADMIKSINILLNNLRNTREFALEVGKGNLEKKIDVFGNKGDLGGALIEMRSRLIELAKERKKNEEEAAIRAWRNEGLAHFDKITRDQEKEIGSLSYDFLSELIDFIDANQGAIFILEEENKKTFLKKVAAVAYGRNKIAGDTIPLGQDIVGRCAFEKKTIYMNNVPDNYIKITSGLGYATPRNLILVPIIKDRRVLGVLELASFNAFQKHICLFIEQVSESLADTITKSKNERHRELLLTRAQEQANEITAQEEELRQNMEELEATQEMATKREEEIRTELNAFRNAYPVIETDTEGLILSVNETFCTHFEISEAELRGQPIYSIIYSGKESNKNKNSVITENNKITLAIKRKLHVVSIVSIEPTTSRLADKRIYMLTPIQTIAATSIEEPPPTNRIPTSANYN